VLPGAALSAVLDGIEGRSTTDLRVALSTPPGSFRLAGFAGAQFAGGLGDSAGLAAGVAFTIALPRGTDLVAEALTGPSGENFGIALRRVVSPIMGAFIGANFFPADSGFRVSFGIAFSPSRRTTPTGAVRAPALPGSPPGGPPQEIASLLTGRPRFRLKSFVASPSALTLPRTLQHAPIASRTSAALSRPEPAAAPTVARAPTLEDLAASQVSEQEGLVATRQGRVKATAEQLDSRERDAQEAARQADERERQLGERERQLDGGERLRVGKSPPTEEQRQLESLETQAAAQERNLAMQEQTYAPAIAAALAREKDAGTRKELEEQEAARLAASVASQPTRAQQLEIRKQGVAARTRELAAAEARLLAKGERVDALERRLRTRTQRLDAWKRRLDARTERLGIAERTSAAPKPGTPGNAPAAAPAAPAAPAATATATITVETSVAGAAMVSFATPGEAASQFELDAIDNLARLAVREQCTILVWARAKDPSLNAEAERRATELKARIVAGGVPASRVSTRVTFRPGAKGVDVVVSALREAK
jgi:hypothetical protein